MENSNVSVNVKDVTSSMIENVLNEIEQNEEKSRQKKADDYSLITDIDDAEIDWNEVVSQLRNLNINYIKNLITSNEIDINAQHPSNGKTLLHYSVIIGDIDLVTVICNFGSDVHIQDTDGLSALDYAIKYGRYRITELIYFQELSGQLGNDLKHIKTQIHEKSKQAEIMKELGRGYGRRNDGLSDKIINFMIKVIEQKKPFGPDLLFYAVYFEIHKEKEDHNPLESSLWISMMDTYESILCNTSDKTGWKWLKKYFVNSLIWYLPHPTKTDNDTDNNDMEYVLKQTLFYELLIRVRKESKNQSDLLLKSKIDKIKSEQMNEWKQLTLFDVSSSTDSRVVARQDLCKCIVPKYTKNDLDKYPPSTHFSAKKHYDTNMYLNELLFKANIIDNVFQRDMKIITKQISKQYNIPNVSYRAGPVKTLSRSKSKCENDYINEPFPSSGKILDLNRCAIQFKTINDMMVFINVFIQKVKQKQARSIVDIIRCKNGWSVYNELYPQYTDIKLNVVMSSKEHGTIITEIQFLLVLMSAFKKKAHRLYSVERLFEMVYNFGTLTQKTSTFTDNGDLNGVLMNIAKRDDIDSFKELWHLIKPNTDTLIENIDWEQTQKHDISNQAVYNIMMSKTGKISQYLELNYDDIYFAAITKFLKIWPSNHIEGINDDAIMSTFLNKLFRLVKNKADRKEIIKQRLAVDHGGQSTFLYRLCVYHNITIGDRYNKSVKSILLNDYTLFFEGDQINAIILSVKSYYDNGSRRIHFNNARQFYEFFQNDRKLMLQIVSVTANELCFNYNRNSAKLIKYLLYHVPSLTEKDKKLYFCNMNLLNLMCCQYIDDEPNSYNISDVFINYENLFTILNYFFTQDEAKRFFLKSTELDYEHFCPQTIFAIHFRYFGNDKSFLWKMLSETILWRRVCGQPGDKKRRYYLYLIYILYESSLTDQEKLSLILCDDYVGILYTTKYRDTLLFDDTFYELIKYLHSKKDSKSLFRLLYQTNSNDETVWMAFCISVHDINYRQMQQILDIIDSSFNCEDILKIWTDKKDRHQNTALHQMLNNARLSYSNYEYIIHWLHSKQILYPLISQQTGVKKCIYYVSNRILGTILSLLSTKEIVSLFSDREIIAQDFTNIKRDSDLNGDDLYDVGYSEQLLIDEITNYLQFEQGLSNLNEIDTSFKQYIVENTANENVKPFSTPFITACKLNRLQTVENILHKISADREKTIQLLSFEVTMRCFYKDDKKMSNSIALDKILRFAMNDTAKLILDSIFLKNTALTQDDKLKLLLTTKETYYYIGYARTHLDPQEGETLLFRIDNTYRLLIFDHFKNDPKSLWMLLDQKDKENKSLISYIFGPTHDQEIKEKIARLIFEQSTLTEKEKIVLIKDSGTITSAMLDYVNKEILYSPLTLNALYQACCNTDQSKTALRIYSLLNSNDPKESEIADVLKYQHNVSDNYSKHSTFLMALSDQKHYILHKEKLMELILDQINGLSTDQLKLDILLKKTVYGSGNDKIPDKNFLFFVKNENILRMLFRKFDDHILRTLLFDTSWYKENYDCCYTLQDELRKTYKKANIEQLITRFLDYLDFMESFKINDDNDLLFTQYVFNPFITACCFGKSTTIDILIDYGVQSGQLKVLLLNNYNMQNGNNCLMELVENDFGEIMMNILNVLDKNNLFEIKMELLSFKNKYSGQTIFACLCQKKENAEYIEGVFKGVKDKKVISELLKIKDNTNRSCVDYAPIHIKKVIEPYL